MEGEGSGYEKKNNERQMKKDKNYEGRTGTMSIKEKNYMMWGVRKGEKRVTYSLVR